MEKEEAELKSQLEQHAKKYKFRLNPDKKILDLIIKGLLKNKKEKEELYCPCRVTSGNREKDKLIICPCIYHLTEIKEKGHCHCNLFVS